VLSISTSSSVLLDYLGLSLYISQASLVVLLLFFGNVYADTPLGAEQKVPLAVKEF
jgi:hypothetical protein